MVKFYEANAHFYDSLASLTNALMDYLMAANGWIVFVSFPGITEITKSRLKNLLESELREIVINDSHVGWSLHPLLYRLSHHHCKSGPLFSSTWFSVSSSMSNTGAPLWTPVGAVLSSCHRHTGRAQLPANTIIRPVRPPFRRRPFSQEEITKGFRLEYWNTKKYHCHPKYYDLPVRQPFRPSCVWKRTIFSGRYVLHKAFISNAGMSKMRASCWCRA